MVEADLQEALLGPSLLGHLEQAPGRKVRSEVPQCPASKEYEHLLSPFESLILESQDPF